MGKGKGNGWEIIWDCWKGTLMGDYLEEGEENFGGIILGGTQVGRGRSDENKSIRGKKEIRKVQLFTKTIPSGLRVKFNNVILDNTEIINCHKTITTYEHTDG